MPGALITPEQAARAGVEGLERGDRVVVPGLPIRAAMLASRYIPHALKLPATRTVHASRPVTPDFGAAADTYVPSAPNSS